MPDLDITDAHAYPFATRDRALAALGGGAPDDEAENLGAAFDALLEARGPDVVRVNVVVHVPWARPSPSATRRPSPRPRSGRVWPSPAASTPPV